MVIQCSSCDTRFKLADDKLKPGGVKVRCSKCKEVFTVVPPEEEATPESSEESSDASANDWSDLNGASGDSSENESGSDEGMDWSDIGGDDTADDSDSSLSFSMDDDSSPDDGDISFGDDPASDDGGISFDDSTDDSSDSISFDDTPDDGGSDNISFDDSSDDSVNEDDFGFDEPVGGGAQDEFSFDDEGSDTLEASDDTPDFDWDGSSDSDDASNTDDFDFGDAEGGGEGDLDFSGVAIEEQQESPPAAPAPAPVMEEPDKPLSAKGPQKGTGAKRGRKQKRAKKKGPLRSLLLLIFFILLLVGAHAGVLFWKGYWKGDPAELANLDHQTVHLQVYQELYAELTGGQVVKAPEGAITVLNMNGRFIENSSIGTIFVITGEVKNAFKETRSAIAVRGLLFDQTGKSVMRKKVYCGNKLSDTELKTLTEEKLNERVGNQFGDSLSNLDVAPDAILPYTIVFSKLPENLSEYNVEAAESAPGSQQ
jgi:predicted Zn finger-like uncharacterized protein